MLLMVSFGCQACGGGGGGGGVISSGQGGGTGSVTLSWNPPTTNTDGTPLTNLAGFKIHYGTSSGNYTWSINAGNVASYTLNNLQVGKTFYFVVSAYDTDGNVSEYSGEVFKSL